ncbi:dihydrodipicolinate synthase family protein [Saliphagus infecundisoli]|uniref:Dihydrodipicolinate synthase family protein n=1 Tax=Saliphagus infecundisoli TaxID=1849069 RepID=A0ABD5QL97_9EURY|nr:dihydrodipicolinate synthase family protein [Saliphagus infecundisoli]
MSSAEVTSNLKDAAVGLLTPFDDVDTDEILFEELSATTDWLYDEGIRLFLAGANISEYHSLSHQERIDVVRIPCETLPADATVLAGAGGSTKTAIDLGRTHEENGADAIMVMPPHHTFKHEQGVADYYGRIADAVDVGVVPYLRNFEVTVGLVTAIADHENVVGIKWAIPDIELFAECVASVDSDVVWICGMAEPLAPAYWLEGAEGFTAGATNVEPRLGLAIFDALEASNMERAHELRDLAQPFMNLRSEPGVDNVYPSANSVPVLKSGLECAGRYGGPVREPLVDLTDEDRECAERAYDHIQDGL